MRAGFARTAVVAARARRLEAVELFESGWSDAEIGRSFRVTRMSVNRWRRAGRTAGRRCHRFSTSRVRVHNKTLKYCPAFPGTFGPSKTPTSFAASSSCITTVIPVLECTPGIDARRACGTATSSPPTARAVPVPRGRQARGTEAPRQPKEHRWR
ncbi:helix-turn-helix domain-containing protein [Sphaerisporangium sp. NPDC088356]|uniref:helix-turn-helix domain-containing protein n=1 Tax=Sphaerisporangium sp. NPDC088356 TaxID=3154871 RepID=UPI00343AED1E